MSFSDSFTERDRVFEEEESSYKKQHNTQSSYTPFTYKITPLLSKLSVITKERLETLKALSTGPKTINQIKILAGFGSYYVGYFHLKVLQEHGFVTSTVMTYPCTSRKARGATKDVTIYGLSDLGTETVEYFGGVHK